VIAAVRAELFKQRSTRTVVGLFGAMLALVLLVVLVHGLGLGAENFDSTSKQLTILFGWGEVFGAMFAGLVGAMSITGEIRYGTIRPTFLVTPVRSQVVAAKAWVSMLIGFGFGLISGAVVVGVGTAALNARGIGMHLGGDDFARVILGSAVAAALWGAIGVGVGALVRSQVTALVGIVVWLLFVENLLVGDIAGVGAVGRLLPGASGRAISGQDPKILLSPAVGLVVLILYAAAAGVIGSVVTERRDFV
jgi:ABC-type transport system involved in multi-copper enzyme maturation permease subunit